MQHKYSWMCGFPLQYGQFINLENTVPSSLSREELPTVPLVGVELCACLPSSHRNQVWFGLTRLQHLLCLLVCLLVIEKRGTLEELRTPFSSAHKCPHVQPTCSCYPTSEQMHLRNRQCRLLLHTCAPDLLRAPPYDQTNLNLSMSWNKVERVGYQRVGSFWTLARGNPCNK